MDPSFQPTPSHDPTGDISLPQRSGLRETLAGCERELKERARLFGFPPQRTYDYFEAVAAAVAEAEKKMLPEQRAEIVRDLAKAVPIMMLCGLGNAQMIGRRAAKTAEWPKFAAALSDFLLENAPGVAQSFEQVPEAVHKEKLRVRAAELRIRRMESLPYDGDEYVNPRAVPAEDCLRLAGVISRLVRSPALSRADLSSYTGFLGTETSYWMQTMLSQRATHEVPPSEALLNLMAMRAPVEIIRTLGRELASDSIITTKAEVLSFLGALSTRVIESTNSLSLPATALTEPQVHALGLLNRPRSEHDSGHTYYSAIRPPYRFSAEPERTHWQYLRSRLEKLDSLSGEKRERYLVKELNLFLLQLATQKFRLAEETHFNRLLFGTESDKEQDATQRFYKRLYRADQHPAIYGTPEESEMYRQTYRDMRLAMQARTALNVLKGYTQTTADGDWLVERIAACSGGTATVVRTKDSNVYPGSGCIIEGLDPGSFLDLSTPHAVRTYHEVYPWIKESSERLSQSNFYMFRGFITWFRSGALHSDDPPTGKEWGPIQINAVPYAPVAFSDHFHNWNPEMRLLLVPEIVLAPYLRELHKHGCDPAKVDLTPQSLANYAQALGLPILNVGTAAVLFAGFGSSWEYGSAPYWEWEHAYSQFATPFRDTFHLHHSFQPGKYTSELTPKLKKFFDALVAGQNQVSSCLRAYSGLFQCWMTAEAVWAKEQSYEGGVVATLDPPAPPRREAAGSGESESDDRSRAERGLGDGGSAGASAGQREYSLHPRTRILDAYLEARARAVEFCRRRGVVPGPQDLPRLEIQYAGKYDIVPNSPSIDGVDLSIRRPGQARIPLFTEADLRSGDMRVGEYQELLWYQHFSGPGAFFKLHYGPRIVW